MIWYIVVAVIFTLLGGWGGHVLGRKAEAKARDLAAQAKRAGVRF